MSLLRQQRTETPLTRNPIYIHGEAILLGSRFLFASKIHSGLKALFTSKGNLAHKLLPILFCI